MGPIKVAIADDHKIFRKGVILSLRPYTNLKFVLEAENGQELLDLLAATPDEDKPEVILMDLRMPKKTVSKPPNWLPNNTPAFISSL